jgi:hypothetical protein
MSPAEGYKVCHVQVRTVSVVPASGDRASLFSLTATSNGVSIYTWTPRQKTGQGRSWYDGYVAITFVKASLYPQYLTAGKCTIPATGKKAYACRGAKGVNKGLKACGSAAL